MHRTLRLRIQRLNDQVNRKRLVEPSRLSSDWIGKAYLYGTFCGDSLREHSTNDSFVKRRFDVKYRYLMEENEQKNLSKLFSMPLVFIQFHERNFWTECTLFSFPPPLRLSKSVSLTPVQFDPLSSSLWFSFWLKEFFGHWSSLREEGTIYRLGAVKQCLHCSISSTIERNPVS